MKIEEIILDSEIFVQQQLDRVAALWVEIKWMLIDHICIRVDSDTLYDLISRELAQKYTWVWWEKMVWWRRISIFDIHDLQLTLQNPYDTLLELPAPKTKHNYPNWLQHIEIVYAWRLEELLEKHPDLHWDKSWFEKEYNRDLAIWFDDMSEVKFHEQSLREVLSHE